LWRPAVVEAGCCGGPTCVDVIMLFSLTSSVQDYFVRAANQKKGMLASSHLVLQTPEGTKYQAARKWGLPAVTMGWILESARVGQRADEDRYLVDRPPSPGRREGGLRAGEREWPL